MAVTVNSTEAKTNFSKLINRVIDGEEIIIAKTGVPVARLTPFQECKPERKPGSAKGIIEISPDFNDPLPDDLLDLFEK
ncbi:MAG: type II toxin-antitoxin system Phd/YefM family antitoxin [Candidatus Omnitrophota bacterium]|nr:MAG: type II toxin-antitoxin system Phd/YefM family antitoxin [Candidatus Omnitrophota bacterium]